MEVLFCVCLLTIIHYFLFGKKRIIVHKLSILQYSNDIPEHSILETSDRNTTMTIDYKLHEYNFATGADYRARVQYQRVIDLDGVINEMAMHNTGISRAIMMAVFQEFFKTLLYLLLQGHKIVTPFGVFGVTIKGTFETPDDKFDSRRHTLELTITPGDQLKQDFAAKARVRKRRLKLPQPELNQCLTVTDSTSGSLIPGRMASIQGRNLKFDLSDPTQGIFLTPVKSNQNPESIGPPIRVEDVGHNKGRKLIFVVPLDLPAGTYRLEVCARFGRHSLRTGQLGKLLIVA